MLNLFGDALSVAPDASRPIGNLECRTVNSSGESTVDLGVPNGEPVMLQSTNDASAALYLNYLEAPSQLLKQAQLAAATPEWVHLPDTGKPIVWQLRIRASSSGTLRVCSVPGSYLNVPGTYAAAGATFVRGPGWSPVADPGAANGTALKAEAGTPGPAGAYGTTFIPKPGIYDIWFRVRVSSTVGGQAEMILTLTDVTASRYVVARTFKPSEASVTYRWLLVASSVKPPGADMVRFQTNIAAKLSTDWYVDQAAMVPAGFPPPGP
jgi:hypothetical protein